MAEMLLLVTSAGFMRVNVAFTHTHGLRSDMRMSPTDKSTEVQAEVTTVQVRFINTPSGKDVVSTVRAGENLLFAGDGCGVKLPRACRTGLCGSCTVDVVDPNALITEMSLREGFATLRACSTKCFVPPGMGRWWWM